MRKIFLVLLTVLCLSCTKDDDSSNSAISINPPEWMHGTWAWTGFEDDGPIFRITSNDVIYVVNTSELSYKGQLEGMAKSGAEVSVDEVITEDTYEVTFDMSQGYKVTYSFTKLDGDTVLWTNTGMDMELTKL